MKRLHYELKNTLIRLHEELLEAIPALRPIAVASPRAILGDDLRREAVMVPVEGDADNVWLTVPDDADEAAIERVVAAHKPS